MDTPPAPPAGGATPAPSTWLGKTAWAVTPSTWLGTTTWVVPPAPSTWLGTTAWVVPPGPPAGGAPPAPPSPLPASGLAT